jgi:hypothetical protein
MAKITNETGMVKDILVKASTEGDRLFRNNVGSAWTGQSKRLTDGRMIFTNPRPVTFGLCKGSSDLIGWTNIKMTEDMVGKTFPIFTACEVKFGNGKPSKEQTAFVNYIRSINGVAVIAWSFTDFLQEKKEWIKRILSSMSI